MSGIDLKDLQQKWKVEPQSEVFYPLACTYFDLELHDAAADVLQQGLRHHPDHVKGLTLLGQIQFLRGDADEARDIFNKALKIDPGCIEPLCGLAEIDIAAGNCARAETWLKRAESLEETSWSKKLRQKLEQKQDMFSAIETELPFVTETMVDLYLRQGMKEKAFAALRQLVIQNPDDGSLRKRLDELLSSSDIPSKKQALSKSYMESRLNAWLRALERQKQRR